MATGPVSASNGTFSIPVPPGTGYTIQVTATGFATYDSAPLTYDVTPLTATPVPTITLTP